MLAAITNVLRLGRHWGLAQTFWFLGGVNKLYMVNLLRDDKVQARMNNSNTVLA